ncbi:MAG: LEA type 2 family protein [Natronospirillum sp.]
MPRLPMLSPPRRWLPLCLLSVFMLASCALLEEARWREPEIRLLSTQLVRLTPTGAHLDTRFEVLNPNAFSIAMGALDYTLEVNDTRVFSGEQGQGSRLAAGGRQEVTLPLTVDFSELAALVTGFADRDTVDYRVAGGMSFDIPIAGTVRVPAEASGALPIPRLPQVQVDDLAVSNLSFRGVDMMLTLRVSNPNTFALLLDRFSYQFALDDTLVAGGDARQRVRLDEGGRGMIELPFSVSFEAAGRSLYTAIVAGQSVSYGLSFASDLRPDLPQMDVFPFSVVRDGDLRLQ